MKKLNIRAQEQSILNTELSDFETKFNILLPSNYKKLILKCNGGITSDSDFFKVLLSIKNGKNTVESVINIHQILEKNIPKEFLPIASDWSNNEITICLKEGENYGKIFAFYFDVNRVEKIADSLEELLGVKNIEDL